MVREAALCRTKGLTEAHRFGKGRGCRTNSLLACIWPPKPGSGRIWSDRRFSPPKRPSAGQSQRLPSTSDRRRPFAVPKPLSEVGPCAAIVPGQEPESHDAGMSRFGENGSHLAATDAAEGHAGQVEGSGMSGKCRNRLTPGRDGCRRGPCGADGRVRYERKMPEQAHTWPRRMPQRTMRGRWRSGDSR